MTHARLKKTACWKKDGGCQNNTTSSVEYSREGSKVDGINPLEALLGIWACNVPVWKHQSSALWACSVPVWERPASGARRESEPTGGRVVALSLFGVKSQETALTAPEGAGGSELLLLDERRESSVFSRE